jgi:hypothetical protein
MDQDWTTVRREKNRSNDFCKKFIHTDSLQALIRKRIEMKLTQEKADILCVFPRNTFKNIESRRIIPSEEQKHIILEKFSVYLTA